MTMFAFPFPTTILATIPWKTFYYRPAISYLGGVKMLIVKVKLSEVTILQLFQNQENHDKKQAS
jgi:hypothetical protein